MRFLTRLDIGRGSLAAASVMAGASIALLSPGNQSIAAAHNLKDGWNTVYRHNILPPQLAYCLQARNIWDHTDGQDTYVRKYAGKRVKDNTCSAITIKRNMDIKGELFKKNAAGQYVSCATTAWATRDAAEWERVYGSVNCGEGWYKMKTHIRESGDHDADGSHLSGWTHFASK